MIKNNDSNKEVLDYSRFFESEESNDFPESSLAGEKQKKHFSLKELWRNLEKKEKVEVLVLAFCVIMTIIFLVFAFGKKSSPSNFPSSLPAAPGPEEQEIFR